MHTQPLLLHKIAQTIRTAQTRQQELILLEMANMLLEVGYGAHYINEDEETALHFAAASGNTDLIILLIRWGAKVDAKNYFGMTPFFYAVGNGHLRACRFFYGEVNAQVAARTLDLKTVLHCLYCRDESIEKIKWYDHSFITSAQKVEYIVRVLTREFKIDPKLKDKKGRDYKWYITNKK